MKSKLPRFPVFLVCVILLTTMFSGCEDDDDDDDNTPPVLSIEISQVNWAPYPEGMRLEREDRILFDASKTYDPDGDVLLSTDFKWDFDDSDGVTSERTGKSATKSYAETGDYTVTLRVDDGDVEESLTMDITINEKGGALRADIVLQEEEELEEGEVFVVGEEDDEPDSVDEEELTLHFDGSGSTSDEGTITSYRWDFSLDDDEGFNEEASGTTVSNDFSSGFHPVMLNITNETGGTAFEIYRLMVDYNHTYRDQMLDGQDSGENETDYLFPINTVGCLRIRFELAYNVNDTYGYNEDDLDLLLYNATGDEIANTQDQENGSETIDLRYFDGMHFSYREQLGDWTIRVINENEFNEIYYDLFIDIYYSSL